MNRQHYTFKRYSGARSVFVFTVILTVLCVLLLFSGCSLQWRGSNGPNDAGDGRENHKQPFQVSDEESRDSGRIRPRVEDLPEEERTAADWIVYGARQEVERGVQYDMSYYGLDYPGGDPPEDRGACTDVVVRALRYAGIDLQKRIHEDMSENFALYPDNWGLSGPDSNIDHRRVANQVVYFERHGNALPVGAEEDAYKPGNIIVWKLNGGRKHVGIVSDQTTDDGTPLILHNISGAAEEDVLKRWEIIGHYRYPKLD